VVLTLQNEVQNTSFNNYFNPDLFPAKIQTESCESYNFPLAVRHPKERMYIPRLHNKYKRAYMIGDPNTTVADKHKLHNQPTIHQYIYTYTNLLLVPRFKILIFILYPSRLQEINVTRLKPNAAKRFPH